MQKIKKIDPRPNISLEIADKVRRMIVERKFSPGERINEVHLAAELGVSRTPLREALSALVVEGALKTVPRKGFFVTPLSVEELENIYPVRAILDPEALRLAGIPSEAGLNKLENIKNKMLAAVSPETVIDLDNNFHLELLNGCPNSALIEIIKQFMNRTRRYEFGLMSNRESVEKAVKNKEKIILLLRSENLEGACLALKQMMQRGQKPIIQWLKKANANNSEDT